MVRLAQIKDEFCAGRRFEKPSGLNEFDSYANVLFERNILERFPIQDLIEKMDIAMGAVIHGIGLKASTQGIRPFDQVIACPLLLKSRRGQILPYSGERHTRSIPLEGQPGILRGDNETSLFLFALPDFAEVQYLHFDFAKMS